MNFLTHISFILLTIFANICFAARCSSFQELRFVDGSTACMSDYKFFTIKRPPNAPDGLVELIPGKQSFSIAINKNLKSCPLPRTEWSSGGAQRPTATLALNNCEKNIIEQALKKNIDPEKCECELIYDSSPNLPNIPLVRKDFEQKTRAWAAATQNDPRFKSQYSSKEFDDNSRFYAEYMGESQIPIIDANKQSNSIEKPKPQVNVSLPNVEQSQKPTNEKIQATKERETKLNNAVEPSQISNPVKTLIAINPEGSSKQTTKSVKALVIGNSNYGVSALINPANDAQAIAKRLAEFGFKVDLVLDGNRKNLISALTKYQAESSKYDINILFYAGHGIQLNGINYIIPVDMSLAPNGANVEFDAIPVNSIVEKYMQANTKLVFLDACRDNPLSRSLQVASRSSGGASRGLAPMEVGGGTLISYSTKDGSVALDGDGKNSPYTEAMLAHMNERIDISLLLRKIRKTVMAKTNGKQVPWDYGSLLTDELVLSNK